VANLWLNCKLPHYPKGELAFDSSAMTVCSCGGGIGTGIGLKSPMFTPFTATTRYLRVVAICELPAGNREDSDDRCLGGRRYETNAGTIPPPQEQTVIAERDRTPISPFWIMRKLQFQQQIATARHYAPQSLQPRFLAVLSPRSADENAFRSP